VKLGLFSERQLPYCGVIGATSEYHDGTQKHASPAQELSVIPHSILLFQDGLRHPSGNMPLDERDVPAITEIIVLIGIFRQSER
jgi:hypothetical protein